MQIYIYLKIILFKSFLIIQIKDFPDYIIGDLDSAKTEVLDYFEEKGTKIKKSPCQDSTDLEKVLTLFQEDILTKDEYKSHDIRFMVLGGLGGRMDHTLTNLSHL